MDAKRVDLMPAAAVLVDFVLQRAGATDLVACTWALREGLLLELAMGGDRRRASARQARRRSVEALAARFAGENAHGQQVARLALALFDGTAHALGLGPAARELLEYAALLHDIGHAIDHDRHHRHTHYLIRNAELLGFEPEEIEVVAAVARGHRKQIPKPGDPHLRALRAPVRRRVRSLAAILRLADGLDRTRFGVVKRLDIRLVDERLLVSLETRGADAELELWAASRRADLLGRLLGREVALRVAPADADALTVRATAARRA
jgi:exopolyphosphatase/guanosine-5'-triphosphate,3'-diphosphate pyrophosphatase